MCQSANNYTKIRISGFFDARSDPLSDMNGTFITDISDTRLPVVACVLRIQKARARLISIQAAVSQVMASRGTKW